MSRSKPSWLSTVAGEVYTLHFWPPYGDPEVQVAGHYTGWAQEGKLASRLVDHTMGRGARLTQVQREAGGTWVVADVEPGTRDRETQLKERGASRRCSVCKAVREIEAGSITQEEALAKWETASPAERSLLREIFGMEPAPEAPDPVPVREITPAPAPEPARELTAEDDALIDALCEGWQRQQAEALARAEAEVGPEAAPERARELLRAESNREVPNPLLRELEHQAKPEARVEAEAEIQMDREMPHPASDPAVQAEITPRADVQLEAAPAEAEAEPEPELEIG